MLGRGPELRRGRQLPTPRSWMGLCEVDHSWHGQLPTVISERPPTEINRSWPGQSPEVLTLIADWDVCPLEKPSSRLQRSNCRVRASNGANFRCRHAPVRRVEVLPPCTAELPALRVVAEVHWKLDAPGRHNLPASQPAITRLEVRPATNSTPNDHDCRRPPTSIAPTATDDHQHRPPPTTTSTDRHRRRPPTATTIPVVPAVINPP